MLAVDRLSFSYTRGSSWLFRDLSFSAERGERIVLVGANGSGKSTLARILGGLIPLQQGRITLNGVGLSDLPGEERPITLLQRFDELFVATHVDREIAVNFELAGLSLSDIRTRIETQAEQFGIQHLLTRSCQTLSPGERLRLALAAQFSRSTSLILVDEADAFLDIPGRQLLHRTLQSLANSRTTILRVSHDFASIDPEERVLLLHNGQLVDCGRGGAREALRQLESHSSPPGMREIPKRETQRKTIASLSFDHVTFSITKEIHFGPISLTLTGNTLTGLIGVNGSGKSILAQLAVGLLTCASGKYLVTESNVEVTTSSRLLPDPSVIGYLPPEPERFFTAATVGETVLQATSDRVPDWAAILDFDVATFHDRDPLTLSGGEQRRLALLAALQHDPVYLVLDEPTANLDLSGRARFSTFLTSWHDSGRGGLIISHDRELLQQHCSRILTLDEESVSSV